jgi:Uma2 family endonuclease
MADPARRDATYADLLEVPEHLVAEIVDGELITSPRPALRHALASSALGGELSGPFQRGRGGPGGWWIIFEPELHFGRQVLVPDLAGWRKERVPVLPDAPAMTLAPDWLCEVISPSTGRLDRARKLPLYASMGVNHVWVVDPAARTLEVLRRDEEGWRIVRSFGDDDLVRAEPFEAAEIDLLALWGETRAV